MSEVKTTEAILKTMLAAFREADEERLRETYKAREEAEKWKAEGDMYGWNFHQGVSAGTIWASIYFFRVQRRIEAEIAALGITLKPDNSTTPTP